MMVRLRYLWWAIFPPEFHTAERMLTIPRPSAADTAAMVALMRRNFERHIAQHIFVEVASRVMSDAGVGASLSDALMVQAADYSRRAARLYANGEDFGP